MTLPDDRRFSSLGKGSYAIIFHLTSHKNLRIGKLGEFLFPRGYYVYVGSAFGSGGLKSRIYHHLKLSTKPHWHVDYFRKKAAPVEVWVSEYKERQEHRWALVLNRLKGAAIPSPGFGSSDCKCLTHLYHFEKIISFRTFINQYRQLYADSSMDPIKRIKILS